MGCKEVDAARLVCPLGVKNIDASLLKHEILDFGKGNKASIFFINNSGRR
jgi:hypothetical protein